LKIRPAIITVAIGPGQPVRLASRWTKTGQRKWHYQFIHHDIWD
jgi:hypothetical protein